MQQPPSTHSPQLPSPFLARLRLFLKECRDCRIPAVKIVRGGFGFALLNSHSPNDPLHLLCQQIFECPLEELQKQAHMHGLTVRRSTSQKHKEATLFLSRYKVWEGEPASDSISEEPQGEEGAIKEGSTIRGKDGAVVSTILVNRAAEGSLGFNSVKEEEGLPDRRQANCETSALRQSGPDSAVSRLSEVCPHSLSQRISLEKSNYEKCSILIDGMIVDLLEAHRRRDIRDKRELLLGKVVEIYDMLSDGLENSESTLRQASLRQGLRQDDKEEAE